MNNKDYITLYSTFASHGADAPVWHPRFGNTCTRDP